MLYANRYQANKARMGGQVVVKVDNGEGGVGYRLMSIDQYNVWRKQR
jgi:starvation-inducible outer membrane lipoprotein